MGTLRFALAVCVLGAHLGPIFGVRMLPGDVAVECFFVISGFYMSLVLGDKYPLNGAGIRTFYKNRYWRLAPAYWVMAILCLLQLWFWGSTYGGVSFDTVVQLFRKLPGLDALWIGVTNFAIIGMDATMFQKIVRPGLIEWTSDYSSGVLPVHKLLLIPQAWSLGCELAFYAVAPILAARSSLFISGLAGVSVMIRLALAWNGHYEDPWASRFFPSEFVFFAVGMLGHRIYKRRNLLLSDKAGYLVVAILCALLFIYPGLNLNSEAKRWAFLAVFSIAIPYVFSAFKDDQRDREIGELSYPLYLCHTFFHQLIGQTMSLSSEVMRVVTISSSIGFAWVLRNFVELRIEAFRVRSRLVFRDKKLSQRKVS